MEKPGICSVAARLPRLCWAQQPNPDPLPTGRPPSAPKAQDPQGPARAPSTRGPHEPCESSRTCPKPVGWGGRGWRGRGSGFGPAPGSMSALVEEVNPDLFRSLRGRKVEWGYTDVKSCSLDLLASFPASVIEGIRRDQFKGPSLVKDKDPTAKTVKMNHFVLAPIMKAFSQKVASVYALADASPPPKCRVSNEMSRRESSPKPCLHACVRLFISVVKIWPCPQKHRPPVRGIASRRIQFVGVHVDATRRPARWGASGERGCRVL